MKIIKATQLSDSQKATIVYLWNREFPVQLAVTRDSFESYLHQSTGHSHLLILDDANEIIGWAFSFDRNGERWFSIIINSLYQHLGMGRMLLTLLKEKENKLSGWVIDHPHDLRQNGEPYASPLSFYLKNGFVVCHDTRYEDEKISAVKIEWTKE